MTNIESIEGPIKCAIHSEWKQSLRYVSIARHQFAFAWEIRAAVAFPLAPWLRLPIAALIDVASISIESQ